MEHVLSPGVIALVTAIVGALFGLLGNQVWQHRKETRRAGQIENSANLSALREVEWDLIRAELERLTERDKKREQDLKKVRADIYALVRYVEDYRLWGSPYDTTSDPAPEIPARLRHLLEP